MKSSIEWHEECLHNQKRNLDGKRKQLEELEKSVDDMARDVNFYVAQINLAKKEKKDGFDRDKYAISRIKNSKDK